MRQFSDLFPLIVPHVPGAPEPLIRAHCALAARQLCSNLRCWSEWLEPVQAQAPGTEYDLEAPLGAHVILVEAVTVNGRDGHLAAWRTYKVDPALAGGDLVVPVSHAVFRLGGNVPPGAEIRLRVVLEPTRDAVAVPDHVLDLYGEAIADGAIASLMLLPGQPFSNPQMAGVHAGAFVAAVDSAHPREWRSRTNVTPRVRPTWC